MNQPVVAGSNIFPIQQILQEGFSPRRSPQERKLLKQHIPELLWLERLVRNHPDRFDVRVEKLLDWQGPTLPIYSLTMGNRADTTAPTLLLTGGVHGVERIGTQVLLSWLQSLLKRLDWDNALEDMLAKVQLVIVPIVNPTGMYANTRCNSNGIDLNRNAPIDAEDKTPWLGGGHRLGNFLPWYRGKRSGTMEPENAAIEQVIHRQVFNRKHTTVLDLHSGFGLHDRIWFPYAFRKKPIGEIDQYMALKLLWERTYSYHNYIFEPQSVNYLSHGDIWDYFCLQSKHIPNCNFIALTLEMGSWAWVKKRPRQLLSFSGLFHPQIAHRHSRVLRRHLVLLDFLLSATLCHENWMPDKKQEPILKQAANSMWFES